MKYADIIRELNSLFPRLFKDTDRESLKELSSMTFPKGFVKMFAERSPSQLLDVGQLGIFSITELINENIWESPGEDLYDLGFPIVGLAPDGKLYCLSMKEKNKSGENDVLLVDPGLDYSMMSPKEARAAMKFLGGSFEAFVAKEIGFARKALKKK